MRGIQAYLLAVTAMTGQAFVLPRDSPGGPFHADQPRGTQTVRAAPDSVNVSPRSPANTPIIPTPYDPDFYTSWCGCNEPVDESELDDAIKDLVSQLDGGPREHAGAVYSIKGSTVAFSCPRDPDQGPWTSTPRAALNAVATIKQQCQGTNSGTFQAKQYPTTPFTGYMRYSEGLDFCSAARMSNSRAC